MPETLYDEVYEDAYARRDDYDDGYPPSWPRDHDGPITRAEAE